METIIGIGKLKKKKTTNEEHWKANTWNLFSKVSFQLSLAWLEQFR